MLSVYFNLSLASLLIIGFVWHLSFPWFSPFFILMKINTQSLFRFFHCSYSKPCYLTPILPLFFKLPVFIIPLDLSAQRFQHFPSVSFVLKRMPSVFLSTSNPRSPTSLVFRRALFFLNIHPLYRSNPRPRTSTSCRCVSTEELLVSFNSQDQTPDDPYS